MSNLIRHAARSAVVSLVLLLALAGPAGAKEFEDGEEVPEGEMVITGGDADEPVSSDDPGQPMADPDEDGVWEPAEPAPVLEEDGEATIQPVGVGAATGGAQAGEVATLPTTGPSVGLALLALAGLMAVGGGATLVAAGRRTQLSLIRIDAEREDFGERAHRHPVSSRSRG